MSYFAKRVGTSGPGGQGVTGLKVPLAVLTDAWGLNPLATSVAMETSEKAPLTVTIHIEESLRIRLLQLHISPAGVLRTALSQAVKKKELELELKAVRQNDPRVKVEDLKKNTARMRRLRGV